MATRIATRRLNFDGQPRRAMNARTLIHPNTVEA